MHPSPTLLATFALAAASMVLGACRTSPAAGTPADGSIAFRNVSRGYQTAVADAGIDVARTPEEWRALWNRHTSTVLPRPEIPPVDFAREMVVCARLGTRPTTGYALEIVRLTTGEDGALLVDTHESKPAPDTLLAQVVTRPFHMVATAKRDGVVRAARP